ncbi:MAG TPA: glycosyltransferase [Chitinispirillaceae bacterium]|nr:glycosyltransferase [Chitinispirillaceae bacterium]
MSTTNNLSKRKIKILQVTHDLEMGGLQKVIVNICRNIDKSKFDISVLCLRKKGAFSTEIEQLGVPVTIIPQKQAGTDYFTFLKIARFFKQNKPDVVHTHNTQPLIEGGIAALISGVKRVIHTDHAKIYPDRRRYMIAEWFISHFVSKIVGVSDYTSRELHEYERISRSKITTILNGIDPVFFSININKINKKKEFDILSKGPILGIISRLITIKGIGNLLKSMPAIIKNHPDSCLIVAGDGPSKHDLMKQTISLGIVKNVLFIGPRSDIAQLLKLFDILVLPSLKEGLPMILLEAMAAECPIIASNVGGIPEIIENKINGLLVEPGNIADLTKAILGLLADPLLRKTIIHNNISAVHKKYTAAIMTEKYQKLYSDF